MIFDLTEEDRAELEAIRKHRGLRSHAETLRDLIRTSASASVPGTTAGVRASTLSARANKLLDQCAVSTWSQGHRAASAEAESGALTFGPQRPKPGSRLKVKK